MSIPTQITEKDFNNFILHHLTIAKRGFVSKIPLYKIFNYILKILYTGCQWKEIPIEVKKDNPNEKEISYSAVYHHFKKWTDDGCFEKIFENCFSLLEDKLDLSVLNLDGTHTFEENR